MRETNHDLERLMARRVYVRMRKSRCVDDGSSTADSVL